MQWGSKARQMRTWVPLIQPIKEVTLWGSVTKLLGQRFAEPLFIGAVISPKLKRLKGWALFCFYTNLLPWAANGIQMECIKGHHSDHFIVLTYRVEKKHQAKFCEWDYDCSEIGRMAVQWLAALSGRREWRQIQLVGFFLHNSVHCYFLFVLKKNFPFSPISHSHLSLLGCH